MVMRIKEDRVCLMSGVSLIQFTESRDLAVAMFILANGRNTESMLRRYIPDFGDMKILVFCIIPTTTPMTWYINVCIILYSAHEAFPCHASHCT